jgi:hypothetical protein
LDQARDALVALPLQVSMVLHKLTSDPCNKVFIISGRAKSELGEWFKDMVGSCPWPACLPACLPACPPASCCCCCCRGRCWGFC